MCAENSNAGFSFKTDLRRFRCTRSSQTEWDASWGECRSNIMSRLFSGMSARKILILPRLCFTSPDTISWRFRCVEACDMGCDWCRAWRQDAKTVTEAVMWKKNYKIMWLEKWMKYGRCRLASTRKHAFSIHALNPARQYSFTFSPVGVKLWQRTQQILELN